MARSAKQSILNSSINLLKRTPRGKKFLTRLANGCNNGCDYDEAEGALINHCAACQFDLTQQAYELFVRGKTG